MATSSKHNIALQYNHSVSNDDIMCIDNLVDTTNMATSYLFLGIPTSADFSKITVPVLAKYLAPLPIVQLLLYIFFQLEPHPSSTAWAITW